MIVSIVEIITLHLETNNAILELETVKL